MKYVYFTTAIRGFVSGALRTSRTGVLIAGALLLFTIGIAGGVTLATTQTAQAAGICQANGGYKLPPTLALSTAPNGLTVQDNGFSNYGVGGQTVADVRDALNTCAPSFMGANKSGEFLAYTSYTISWSYDTQVQADGTCRLANIKVGLHLSQLEPSLVGQPSPEVKAKWAPFIKGLQTHEDGHKAIDIAQANSLLGSLQALHATCATIESRVNATTNSTLQNLITANADHDTQTDYGRDQGASW